MKIKELISSMFSQMRTNFYLPVVEHQVYSEEETVIGVWTDGKPLYRKVVDCGALPNSTSKEVAHGIDNIETIVDIAGISSSQTVTITIPYCHPTNPSGNINISVNSNKIVLGAGVDRTAFTNTNVTIHYTKTTDTPQSTKIPFEPLIEYSTDEKMIGYWIDGKKLYRKVVAIDNSISVPPNTWTSLQIQMPNADRIIKFDILASNSAYYAVNADLINGVLSILNTRNVNITNLKYGIVEYTKTTDVTP